MLAGRSSFIQNALSVTRSAERQIQAARHGARLGDNIGYPGYATPAMDEVFNTFVIPNVRARRDEISPQGAAGDAEAEIRCILAKWRQARAGGRWTGPNE